MTVSLLCAIGSALAYGASTLMQAVATRRTQGLAAVMTPLVIGAFVVDGLGFVLSILALNTLPLFVVQSIMASMLVVVVIGARFILHARMRRLDVAAVVVVIVALVLIGLGSGEQPAVAPPGVVRAGDARRDRRARRRGPRVLPVRTRLAAGGDRRPRLLRQRRSRRARRTTTTGSGRRSGSR